MTPQEFRAIRKSLGLTQAELAQRLEYGSAVRISEIETGAEAMPRLVAKLMQAYAAGYVPNDAVLTDEQRAMLRRIG